jgi:anti-sigma factor RsiW
MTTSFHDVELLSAYLDGQLNPSDSARLESRLISDPQLRAVMDDLRAARRLLRRLPARRAPRNFTLTPRMAGLKAPEPRTYPLFRMATVLATFLFLASFAVNGLAPLAAPRLAAAPAPALGYGGGGGGPEAPQESAPAATEAQTFAAAAPTPTPAYDLALAPTAESNAKGLSPSADNAGPAESRNEGPVSFAWQIALGGIAILCGLAAWLSRSNNERRFRGRWDRK